MRAHADDLREEVEDDDLVEALISDYRRAPLERVSARAPAMCAHADKLTRAPHTVTESDIGRLRDAGCSDRAILDLTHIVGFFAYYNRLVDGLGADPEPDWD